VILMIRNVKVTSDSDSREESLEVECIFDDSERRIERKLTVTRCSGEESSNNPYGTNGKIVVTGNFCFVESDHMFQLDEHSIQDAEDALSVFKAIFGETQEND